MKQRTMLAIALIISLIIPFLLYGLYEFDIVGKISFTSILYSCMIMSFNFGLGILSHFIGINRSNTVFLSMVWGGMFIRLILLVMLTFLTLKFLEINKNTFIFSSFIFYILYLIIEIFYLNLRKNK